MLLYRGNFSVNQTFEYLSFDQHFASLDRTYGIDSKLVDEILNILLEQFTTGANDRLNICTVRTIAQFMIERKSIIVCLLESARKYPPVGRDDDRDLHETSLI